MSKFYKITGVILGICLALGIMFVTVGTAMGASGTVIISKEDGIKIVDESYRWNYKDMNVEPFKNINIHVNCADVNIVPSTGDNYGIEFSMLGDESAIDFINKDGTLVIMDKSEEGYISFNLDFFNLEPENNITLYVPVDVYIEDITITGDVGDLKIEGLKSVKNIEIGIDVGDVDIKQINCENMNIITDVGDADIDNVNISNRLNVTMDVGDFDFEGKVDGDIDIEVNVGDVDVVMDGKESDYKYDLSVDVGGIDAFGYKNGSLEGNLSGNREGRYSMHIVVDVGDLKVSIK